MTRWQNWSGAQACQPRQFLYPSSEEELASIVSKASRVRVVGASHSFSALVPTDDTLISLDQMTGVIATDSCLLYTSPSPRDKRQSRMPSSA